MEDVEGTSDWLPLFYKVGENNFWFLEWPWKDVSSMEKLLCYHGALEADVCYPTLQSQWISGPIYFFFFLRPIILQFHLICVNHVYMGTLLDSWLVLFNWISSFTLIDTCGCILSSLHVTNKSKLSSTPILFWFCGFANTSYF